MFNDEIGGDLVKEIPPRPKSPENPPQKKKPGLVAKACTEVPRLSGESRAAWKNRVFDHLRKVGSKTPEEKKDEPGSDGSQGSSPGKILGKVFPERTPLYRRGGYHVSTALGAHGILVVTHGAIFK